MVDNAAELMVFWRFSNSEFQCPKNHRRKPDMKQLEKHRAIRSSPNMKPQTQRETTPYPSFTSLGSAFSPDTEQTRHEITSPLGGFSAATTVEVASQGCPCWVQQQCCLVGVWFHWGVCGPLRLSDNRNWNHKISGA